MKQKRLFLRFLSLYKNYKKDVSIIILGSIIGAISSLIYPYISKYIIEDVVYMDLADAIPVIIKLSVIYVIMMGADIIYNKIYNYNSSVLYANIVTDIKESLYRKLHKLSFAWFDDIHTGRILTVIDGDSDNSSHLLSDILPNLVNNVIQLVGGIIVFYTISPIMMTYIAPLILTLIIFDILITPKMKKQFKSIRDVLSVQNELVEDQMSGIRTTQSYGMEKQEISKFLQYNDKLKELIAHKWKLIFIHSSISESLSTTCYGVFLIAGSILVIKGKIKATDIALFYMYFYIIERPIRYIGSVIKDIGRCFASFERVVEILDADSKISEDSTTITVDLNSNIRFSNVGFKYRTGSNIITNLNLTIKKGEHVAIVGESGSGKSTLACLVPRYYDVTEGAIYINHANIKYIDLHLLRRSIGFISQEPFLYNVSILDNIKFACPSASMDEVINAAKKAGAHKFISKLIYGYHTMVGERGVKLSGGQKQRIAIARLFLLNPPIMIFDEATSALDSVQEKKVQKALNALAEGRTCITIAHRLSTIKDADRILVMDHGEIKEQGTHEELIAIPNGLYYKYYTTQYKS